MIKNLTACVIMKAMREQEFGRANKETLERKVSDILGDILRYSRNAAIVNVGKLNLDQKEVAKMLPEYYQPVSVSTQEILKEEGFISVPKNKDLLVVTDYSDRFYKEDKNKEDIIEGAVRSTVANRRFDGSEFSVLVLSNTLPDPNIFSDGSMPWFNGPIDPDGVWSLKKTVKASLERFRHKIKYGEPTKQHPRGEKHWIVEERFEY